MGWDEIKREGVVAGPSGIGGRLEPMNSWVLSMARVVRLGMVVLQKAVEGCHEWAAVVLPTRRYLSVARA